ncbi:hypothetical protein VST63_05200 [Mycolicibacterium sp. 050232]|uniref:hypothetical protein n=1 Tax=Mycolicibacterium sp. 050232 TaxID=3113982 RepID=UPI002E2B5B30|nr:hypothetical protein [Mycolicibacterium sp. 050232]MED5811750.1 hypothetical protein [Mycolicibacterium sp. 050232]
MNSAEDARAVPVTARTEYLTSRHRMTAVASGTALLLGLVALVALNYAGASGPLTAVVAASLVTIALGAVAYGRLGTPGAVLITVDRRTVYLGDENDRIVSYPLSSLIAVSRAGPADDTTTDGRLLTVRGQQYLTLTFRTDAGSEEWRVAVVESDPAAAEIVRRLESAVPDSEPGVEEPVSRSRIADAGTDDAARRLWEEAARRHNDILGAYGAYELDPAMLLRYPAITDVTVEPTQTFHVALDEAAALRTEDYPGNRGLADAYQQAVVTLRRAWIACESHGKKVGTSYLDTNERAELDTALKLYNHATSSTTPAEQATYYGRVREIVTKLVDRGVLHPPKVQLAQLEGVTRRSIEAARPS